VANPRVIVGGALLLSSLVLVILALLAGTGGLGLGGSSRLLLAIPLGVAALVDAAIGLRYLQKID
jgi:hypothetical protein